MRNIVPNGRKLMILRWVDSLENGFGSYQGTKQPASLSNLAAHQVENNSFSDCLNRHFDKIELQKPLSKEVLNKIKRENYTRLRSYYGNFYLSKDKIKKTKENHLSMRTGHEKLSRPVTYYTLTENGKSKIDWLEDHFDKRNRRFNLTPDSVNWDTIRYPVEGRFGWEIKERKLPRVIDGECMDTGKQIL